MLNKKIFLNNDQDVHVLSERVVTSVSAHRIRKPYKDIHQDVKHWGMGAFF